MSRQDYKLFEEIVDELEELRELSRKIPIIVEGRNDEVALRKLGINGKFYCISNGIPLYEFCEEIARDHPDVILFTDLDAEGKKITRKLKSFLSQMGVRVDGRFRLSLLSKLDTHQVENVYKRFNKLSELLNTPIRFK
jgi:5S rRNA maturation endonuclease (ribonuclease M5)